MHESLVKADKVEADFVKQVDDYIVKNGLDVSEESLPELKDGYELELIPELDLKSAGITSVIWATGYRFDFSLVELPIVDEDGYPLQKRGVTEYPGLYFIGLPFLHTLKSGLLSGVGDDAAHIASAMATSEVELSTLNV
jgi:putative flavoprotein involved in K+ transport